MLSLYVAISFPNSDSFNYSVLIWITFIYLSCLTAVVKIPKLLLNKSGESGIFVLFFIKEKNLNLFTIEYGFSCGLFMHGFYYVIYGFYYNSTIPTVLKYFLIMDVKLLQILFVYLLRLLYDFYILSC